MLSLAPRSVACTETGWLSTWYVPEYSESTPSHGSDERSIAVFPRGDGIVRMA